MNIEVIWEHFLGLLSKDDSIEHADYKKSAGIPFLYIYAKADSQQKELEKAIRHAAAASMKGKQLHSDTEFVRKEVNLYVFRHRFYVPQRKMFCCGNLCTDCIRLRSGD
ncbi:hypothetical protein M3204_15170 [Mesobacillus subterraneus]|jgi:hypothetical protein|uniref:hypothetical protein n=1 Tax=Mesobacillus subterraneus TaxID=285983 RepID=UPI00203F0791|nr:hypothetical protein [Mesobacillus subterraneus]MCM3665758.1 hypothetical protein [Mesobacillus subterraneus]MCM3684502.1 hypothetical protein [Mesobacillus subterraneus]